jgi:SPP1 gp7 family putative phage head morphogenesis protein
MADPPPIRQTITLAPTETIEAFRSKGYVPAEYRSSWDDVWQEEHARAFTVTKVFNNQVLEEIRRSLDKVLSEGGTFEKWRKELLPKLQGHDGVDPRLLTSKARLRIVYDTNLRMSRAAGKWKRIQASKGAAPYLMYDAVKDRRTRPLHRVWGGLDNDQPVLLHVDDPWWDTHFPPCGWNCRCGVIQLSDRDLKRMDLKVSEPPPEPPSRAYRRSDGTVVQVPAGIDPGFAYNPGKAHLAGLSPIPLEGSLIVPHLRRESGPVPPLPAPRPLPASELLPANAPADEVVRSFLDVFDLPPAGEKVILDEVGEPIVISRRMLEGAEGRFKSDKQGRATFARLAARTLLEPDEIWQGWLEEDADKANKSGKEFPARVRRRYVAHFVIDGIEEAVFVALDLGADGWEARTWFQERSSGYFDRNVRTGWIIYRRADPENDEGPA